MHALIIEDEPLVALEIAAALRHLGYHTWDVADTEWEAVLCAERRAPDLIVSDVRLRAGNGIDAVRAIRRKLDVPVIFATANHADVKSAFGRIELVEKPFGQRDIERAIRLVAGMPELAMPTA